jgi:predicted DCC family thiol-disulfide oxidoreductase YuxK
MGSQAVSINEPDPAPAGWILYDDSCGVCRTLIPFGEKTLRKRGFAFAPIQSAWVAGRLNLPTEDLTRDLRLLLPGGRGVQGADVYRYAMKRIWWAYPLYLFSVAPLLRNVFNLAYRTFADHRYQVSRICRLPGAA